MRTLFLYLLAFANLVSVLHLGFYIVGANLYDIKQMKTLGKRTKAKRSAALPLVSIVIPAHNESAAIKRTLDSVRKSSYPNIEIIVVDDGSKDDTAKIVRNYIASLPAAKVSSYLKRKSLHSLERLRTMNKDLPGAPVTLVLQRNQGKAAAMNNAIMNHVNGMYFMCLDADSILHPEAVKRAVAHFADPGVIGVAANVRIIETNTVLGMLQRFEHLVGYRAKKFYTLTNSEFIIGGVASTYLTSIVKGAGGYDTDTMTEDIGLSLKIISKYGNRTGRIIYAADVVAMTEGVQTFNALLRQRYRWKMGNLQNLFKYRQLFLRTGQNMYSRMLTMYRLPMAIISEFLLLLAPVLFGYIIYLSFKYQTPGIFIGAYLTTTMYTLWTLWPDEHLTPRQKLRMSALSFVMYLLFFIMDAVQLYAAFRSVKEFKKIYGHHQGESVWISPERSGSASSLSSI
jgi:poly-beta-1,6-N-acetyl-D-glucosamine synthase